MINMRYRPWDFEDWTWISLEGPTEQAAFLILGAWSLGTDGEMERQDEDGDWISVGGEE